MNKEIENLFTILGNGNEYRTGQDILKELNQNGFVVCKLIYDDQIDMVKYELVKTELYLCQ